MGQETFDLLIGGFRPNRSNPMSWVLGARTHRRFVRAVVGQTLVPPAKRGARVPPMYGRYLIDAPVVWVATRRVERLPYFGKGIGNQELEVDISFEYGLQIIGPGPMSRIFSVKANGKPIKYFGKDGLARGDGTPVTVNVRGSESFKIYWGTEDQPVEDRIVEAFGIQTRLPRVAYLLWDQKRLNEGETWPPLEIEAEFLPDTPLALSPAFYPDVFEGDGVLHQIYDAAASHFTVRGYQINRFLIGNEANIVGQPTIVGSFPITAVRYRNERVQRVLVDEDLRTWTKDNVNTVTEEQRTRPGGGTGAVYRIRQQLSGFEFRLRKQTTGGFLSAPPGVKLEQNGEIWFLPAQSSVSFVRIDWVNLRDASKSAHVTYEFRNQSGTWQYRLVSQSNTSWKEIEEPPAAFTDIDPLRFGWVRLDIEVSNFLALDGDDREMRVGSDGVSPFGNPEIVVWGPLFRETEGTRIDIDQLGGTGSFVPNTGTAEAEDVVEYSGANGAHVLYEILFGAPPRGIGLPTVAFDIASLDAIGAELGDDYRVNGMPNPTQDIYGYVDSVMRDLGVGITFDQVTGLYKFVLLRNQLQGIELAWRDIASTKIERLVMPPTKMPQSTVFSFVDRRLNFAESTFRIPNDPANPELVDRESEDVVEIEAITDLEAAARVASRRVAESLYTDQVVRFTGQFAARLLEPGQVFRLPGDPTTLRVLSVEWRQGSTEVDISAVVDAYGQESDLYVPDATIPSNGVAEPVLDEMFEPYELPRVLSAGQVSIVPLRVRGHDFIRLADVWAGPVGGTLARIGSSNRHLLGGTLAGSLSASGEGWVSELGVEVDVLGPPDYGAALDLSGDVPAWYAGAQLAVIVPSEGEDFGLEPISEIVAVRNVEILSARRVRLEGLLRARFYTRRRAWGPGARIFLIPLAQLGPQLSGPMLRVDEEVEFRSQPFTSSGIPLAEAPSVERTMWGAGVRPCRPSMLRIPSKPPIYSTGLGFTVAWNYSTASSVTVRSGAGTQGYGSRCGPPLFEGTFRVELRDPAQPSLAPLVRNATLTTQQFLASDLTTWAGTEPALIDISVVGIIAERPSEAAELRIKKV